MKIKENLLVVALMLIDLGRVSTNYYCGITNYHTMCRFSGQSSRCSQVYYNGITQQDQTYIVDTHNRLRSQVAQGRTQQLPASNMKQMTWDNELASIAQRWADQCQYGHDCGNCRKVSRFQVGQNVFLTIESRFDQTKWSRAIQAWFHDEIGIFPTSNVSPFVYRQNTGHYSQMVWADTNKIGCGVTTYNHQGRIGRFYVCNYGPAGNRPGSSMYNIGNSCSRCPYPSFCSSSYPGLCY